MAQYYKDSKERDCFYVELTEFPVIREEQYKFAEYHDYDISSVLVGHKWIRAMLIPVEDMSGTKDPQAVHDEIFRSDDREQKKVKTIKKYVQSSLEQAYEDAGDTAEEFNTRPTGLMPESDKYEIGSEAILKFVRENFPERYDQLKLQLEGDSRIEAARTLNISTSTAYKLGEDLKKGLYEILDNLIF